MLYGATRPLTILILASALFAAGCAGYGQSSSSGGGSSMSTTASAAAGAGSLFNSLGGISGVQGLADAFGLNLSQNSAVTKFLDTGGIENAKTGLVNSITKASGQTMPEGSIDLQQALTGKGLDAAAVQGVAESLTGAATTRGLKPDQMAALTSLWEPIGKSLLGG